MVWRREIETKQPTHRCDQSFGLAQRQTEDRPQRQRSRESFAMGKLFSLAAAATLCLVLSSAGPTVAEEERPAFVIVERTATTGPETIQQEYAKLAREILPKYAARYLARSQENTLLEGDGVAPCCVAILQFPNMDAVKHWYDSAEHQEASKVRQAAQDSVS